MNEEKQFKIPLDPKHQEGKDFVDIKHLGFQEPKIKPEDYVYLGATKVPDEIINPSGQWLDYLPVKESQYKIIKKDDKTYYVEPFGCTGFGSNNVWETLHIFLYKEEKNLSDRSINISANNTKQGNNPENPMEVLRKIGVNFESSLPYDDTCISWEAFHSPKPLTPELQAECAKLIKKYEFLHEWVNTSNKENLWSALKRSPLGISVLAWKMRNGLYYKEKGENDTHWVELCGGEYNKFWYVLDSYDNYIKKLEWDYDFRYAKRCYLKKKLNEEENPNPPQNENNMTQLYMNKGTPDIYFIGKGDNLYHRIAEWDIAKDLYSEEERSHTIEMVIPIDKTGRTIFYKDSILKQIINSLTSIWQSLRGQK